MECFLESIVTLCQMKMWFGIYRIFEWRQLVEISMYVLVIIKLLCNTIYTTYVSVPFPISINFELFEISIRALELQANVKRFFIITLVMYNNSWIILFLRNVKQRNSKIGFIKEVYWKVFAAPDEESGTNTETNSSCKFHMRDTYTSAWRFG